MLSGGFGCWAASYAEGFPGELPRPSLQAELAPPCNYMSHTGSLPSCRSQTVTHQEGQGANRPDPDTCWPLSVSHRWPPDLKSKLFQCFPSQAKLDGQSYLSAQTFCDQIKELRPGGLNWHPRCSDLVCTCMCAFSFLMERQLHAALCNISHQSGQVRKGRMQRKDWRPKCTKQGHKSKLPAKAAAKFFRAHLRAWDRWHRFCACPSFPLPESNHCKSLCAHLLTSAYSNQCMSENVHKPIQINHLQTEKLQAGIFTS